MDKEEAIKILRELHDKALFSERTALETLHPELKESEDERVRKSIIGFLKTVSSLKDGKTVSNEDFDSKELLSWVAWLEKQGGQKSTEWDEYDEMYVNALVAIVRKRGATDERLRDELIGWLSCLKCRLGE